MSNWDQLHDAGETRRDNERVEYNDAISTELQGSEVVPPRGISGGSCPAHRLCFAVSERFHH